MSQPTSAPNTWNDYFSVTLNGPPHPMLLKALEAFAHESQHTGFAIDLGCGSGRDTREILRRGWSVLAIDREPAGLYMLRGSLTDEEQSRLITHVSAFETLNLAAAASGDRVDLVNASYSLPFCHPDHFHDLWDAVVNTLSSGGRFSGNFFGVRDAWAESDAMTFFTYAQVEELMAPFELEAFKEVDREGTTAMGDSKHWHVFNVVGRKR